MIKSSRIWDFGIYFAGCIFFTFFYKIQNDKIKVKVNEEKMSEPFVHCGTTLQSLGSSSEPSPQSFVLSHLRLLMIQRWLRHRNWKLNIMNIPSLSETRTELISWHRSVKHLEQKGSLTIYAGFTAFSTRTLSNKLCCSYFQVWDFQV